MKTEDELIFESFKRPGEISALEEEWDFALDERAEQLFQVLHELEDMADDLTDEQFCGMVHQAVTACGFADAVDAWVSLLAVTERRIALIDFRDVMPQPLDAQN